MLHLQNRIDTHFAVIAAATAGFALNSQQANALVVYSGVQNISIPLTVNGLYLNIVTGQYNSTGGTGATVPGWDVNPWGTNTLDMFSPGNLPSPGAYCSPVGSGSTYANLPPLTLVGGTAGTLGGDFTSAFNATPNGSFNFNSSNNLIGFRFFNESSGLFHYGWMRITLGATFASPRILNDWAWENVGGNTLPTFGESEPMGILAGDTGIPAPSALALLGIAGLTAATRRRSL